MSDIFIISGNFEAEEDVTEFVKCKIESLVANIETAEEEVKEGKTVQNMLALAHEN